MAEKGRPRVTVREVAERAGVKPALVNYYFGGKQGLLHAVVELVAARMFDRIREGVDTEGTAKERLNALARAIVAATAEDPYGPRLIVEQVLSGDDEVIDAFVERFAGPNLAAVRSLLEDGHTRGELRDVDPMFVVPSLLGSCVFFFLAEPVMRRLFDLEGISPELAERFADHTAELLFSGLAAPAGETP